MRLTLVFAGLVALLVRAEPSARADDAAADAAMDAGADTDDAAADAAAEDAGTPGTGDASANDGAPPTDAAVDADSGLHGVFQPGTQPLTLTQPLRAPLVCQGCHGEFADYDAYDTWKGTMMANAARDPLFQAALTVANQDTPGSGDLCIRCHSPPAWLAGRSEPPLVENFQPDDFESVQCDFCHRLNEGPDGTPFIGNGRYYVADDFVRRGPIQDAQAPHDWVYSPYHEESRLCGLCHDVSNPLENGFAIERTYTEWLSSSFASEGQTCQSCHFPTEQGPVCGAPKMPTRTAHRHQLAGGNYWMPLVFAGEYPELGRQDAYQATVQNAKDKLNAAAVVTLTLPSSVGAGETLPFTVRVENRTGHKLPTGYPEGRRMWLEVAVTDATGTTLFHSGAYDATTATRAADPSLRTYEVRMAAGGVEGFHFILQDQLLQDNRIPPRGFVPDPDTLPVGRDYPAVGTGPDGGAVLANWDDAPYAAELPKDLRGTIAISATLWYQTTSHEYVDSLRASNTTDNHGAHMVDLWQAYGRAPPFAVATASGSLVVRGSDADAGDASLDGAVDAGPEPIGEAGTDGISDAADEGGGNGNAGVSGCACRMGGGPSGGSRNGWPRNFSYGLALAWALSRLGARPRKRERGNA